MIVRGGACFAGSGVEKGVSAEVPENEGSDGLEDFEELIFMYEFPVYLPLKHTS